MNNEQLILNAAIENGLYTTGEAEQLIEEYGELPLHSLSGWKKRSPAGYEYHVKRGEHGLETRLWKKRKKKKAEEDSEQNEPVEPKRYFYLAKTYLFAESQVELVKLEENVNGNH